MNHLAAHSAIWLACFLCSPEAPPDAAPAKSPVIKQPRRADASATADVVLPTQTPFVVKITTAPTIQGDGFGIWFASPRPPGFRWTKQEKNSGEFTIPHDTPKTMIDVQWTGIDLGSKSQSTAYTIVEVGHGPRPPPDPPGPTPPGPTPPGPTPTTGMIDAPGFHVLVKFDRDKTMRQEGETSILFSESDTSARIYLRKACSAMPDGGMGFRFYPVPVLGVDGPWKAPYDRAQGAYPTATISKNGKGWEGSIYGWSKDQFIARCKEIEALP